MASRTMTPSMKWYCLLTVEEISAVHAVIEAAEAYCARTGTRRALEQAIEALQEARDE